MPDAVPSDDRLWVPQAENVWFRPLCLNRSQGYWMNLLKVRKAGVLSRHRHPQSVHGLVLKGRWHYLEHDWVATEGSYVFEPPGETHTLVVPDDVEEMITFFQVNGIMYYVDPWGRTSDMRTSSPRLTCAVPISKKLASVPTTSTATSAEGKSMGFWPNGCFEGRQVLVTGGTSSIGAAIARAFLSEGARVTVTGVTMEEVNRATAEMPGISAVVLDVRNAGNVAELIGSFEKLDHVVNCAGVIRRGAELEPEVFADVIDINLTGTMRICAAAREKLKDSQGTIVNTASMLSFFGGGLVPGYAASKGGIAQLTKSLAIAYAEDGIRVNAIAPGWIATPLTQALRDDAKRSEAIMARTPLKRWGKPEDLAGGVLYLSSPIASFVTGTVLVIDGGYLIT